MSTVVLHHPVSRAFARSLLVVGPMALALAVGSAWWAARRPSDRLGASVATASAPQVDPERGLAEAIDRARASTVALEYGEQNTPGGRRVATGVVVSDRGDVLSVRVDPPEGRARDSILARDSSGHRHSARWVAADPETGLTLLKLDAADADIRPIRPAARAAVLGAAVFLIGNPYGLAHSVSRGHVSGLARRLEIGPRPLGGLIQVQAPLHPGDSGALLADMQGGWLGLVRGGLAAPGSKDDDDLGFAIPAVDAIWVAGQLRDHRKVDRAFLGIKLTRDSVGPGAEVSSVIAGSPAERANLQAGDHIVWIDDRAVITADDLTDRLDRTPAGDEVVLELIRGLVRSRLTVRTATRPVEPPTTPPPAAEPPPSPPALPPPSAPPSPRAAATLPREVLDRIDRLEKQLEEYRRREPDRDVRALP